MKRTLAVLALVLIATPALAEEPSPVVHPITKKNGGFVAGIVLSSLSGAFLAGGISMVAVASGMQNSFSSFGTGLLFDAGAFAMFGGSLGFGISGIYLLAANAPSHARAFEADVRVAASRDTAPRFFALPIASGSF